MSAWVTICCIFLKWVFNPTEAVIPFTVKCMWSALPKGMSWKMNLWLSRLQRSTRDVSRRQLSLRLWTHGWWGLLYDFSIHNNCFRPTGSVDSYVVLLTGTASTTIRLARFRVRLGLRPVRVQISFLACKLPLGVLSRVNTLCLLFHCTLKECKLSPAHCSCSLWWHYTLPTHSDTSPCVLLSRRCGTNIYI